MNSSFVGISILVKSRISEKFLINILMNMSSHSLRISFIIYFYYACFFMHACILFHLFHHILLMKYFYYSVQNVMACFLLIRNF